MNFNSCFKSPFKAPGYPTCYSDWLDPSPYTALSRNSTVVWIPSSTQASCPPLLSWSVDLFFHSSMYYFVYTYTCLMGKQSKEVRDSCYSLLCSRFLTCTISSFETAQSCLTLCNPWIVYGIPQARILEWVAFPFSRGSSWPRNKTGVSCITGIFFTSWPIREANFTNNTRR